jgi:hypothetical protein
LFRLVRVRIMPKKVFADDADRISLRPKLTRSL